MIVCIVWLGLRLGLGLELGLRVTLELGRVIKLVFSFKYLRELVEDRKIIRNVS